MTKQEKTASLENAMTQGTRGAAKDGQLVAGGEQCGKLLATSNTNCGRHE